MSALPLRRYRVVSHETRPLVTYVDAKSTGHAERLAAKLWSDRGEDAFDVKKSGFDVISVEKVPE